MLIYILHIMTSTLNWCWQIVNLMQSNKSAEQKPRSAPWTADGREQEQKHGTIYFRCLPNWTRTRWILTGWGGECMEMMMIISGCGGRWLVGWFPPWKYLLSDIHICRGGPNFSTSRLTILIHPAIWLWDNKKEKRNKADHPPTTTKNRTTSAHHHQFISIPPPTTIVICLGARGWAPPFVVVEFRDI